VFALAAGCAFRQQRQATRFTLPDDVVLRKVEILSEGARMGGEVCSLKSMAGKKLPTIVMSHGWAARSAACAGTPPHSLKPVPIRSRFVGVLSGGGGRQSSAVRDAVCDRREGGVVR